MRLLTVVKVVIFLLAALLCLQYLPLALSMIVLVLLLSLYILFDASKHRVLLRMAKRNFIRRKGTTALVVAGLMVGTAIIATSFVVGDTLENMIVGEVTRGAGDVDFAIASTNEEGGWNYLNSSETGSIVADIQAQNHIKNVSPVILTYFGVLDMNSSLSSSSLSVMGTNESLWAGFGGWTDIDGTSTSVGPSVLGCYMYASTAKDLDAHAGDNIMIARGNATIVLALERIVENQEPGMSGASTSIFVDISTLRTFLDADGESNLILINTESRGTDKWGYDNIVRDELNTTLASYSSIDLEIIVDVMEAIDDGKANSEMFTQLFFVFGAFSVIAGVALVVNIFTMLGEERKSEMGMARALGMRRVDLRRLFTYEGLLYAAAASLIGTLIGLLIAYVIVLFISGMFQFGEVPLVDYFTFQPFSLTVAFLAGFLITLITVYLATTRISNLNIVRAVKDVPEPPISRNDRRTRRLGLTALIGGFILMLIGMSQESLGLAMSGLSLITLSMGMLLRKFVGDRVAWNIAGWATLILWLPKPGGFKIFDYTMGIEMFVISGLFMVTSTLIIVIFNSDMIVNFITKVFRVRNGYKAVIKTSVSYPLRAKFRTGLSIFIFGLVIFTVTVLSMMSGILDVGIEKVVNESSGGFDLIGIRSSPSDFPENPWEMINSTDGFLAGENVTQMICLPATVAFVDYWSTDTTDGGPVLNEKQTNIVGFNESFYTIGDFPLSDWNSSIYSSEEAVWQAALSNSSLVILDGSWQESLGSFVNMGGGDGASIGQTLTIVSAQNVPENVTVIGIMKQSFFNGVFMAEQHVYSYYDIQSPVIMLINFADGLDVQEQAALMERQFLEYGVVTINVKAIADEVVKMINNMFTLFEAFLSMGLIIGITGLGIITIRSIHERRLEIGMMRAIGYTKRMVVANFAIESAFISALGILIGSGLGMIVGYQLYLTTFSTGSFEFDFVINWVPIVLVGFGTFVATLLSVYPAARGASRVSPAEVLRFE